MLAFLQSQPNLVERILRHIETPSFVDLIGRITQLDEAVPNGNVLEVRGASLHLELRLNPLTAVVIVRESNGPPY